MQHVDSFVSSRAAAYITALLCELGLSLRRSVQYLGLRARPDSAAKRTNLLSSVPVRWTLHAV